MRFFYFASIVSLACACGASQPETKRTVPRTVKETREVYSFGRWLLPEGLAGLQARGGTTQGGPLELATEPTERWKALQEPDLSKMERDRRAILAMAGSFRSSFEFLETVGFPQGYKLDKPYRSWATELILVVKDEPKEIILQHILVMTFRDASGALQGPFVMKHWRQDWTYEDRDMHVYAGGQKWARKKLAPSEVKGKWSQAVYQVDDSPRYEGIGTWVHHGSFSTWESDITWRPLPRREFSVRKDYDVLLGTNRHTVKANGWVHAQDNLKMVLGSKGDDAQPDRFLAREVGLNRYLALNDYDMSEGHRYWEKTQAYWTAVRAFWDETYKSKATFSLRKKVDGKKLYEHHFDFAAQLLQSEVALEEQEQHARETAQAFLKSDSE